LKIILDLDGTLIDYRERAWNLFLLLTNRACTRDFYFNQKSLGVSNHEILNNINKNVDWKEFDLHWRAKIESVEYLEYDEIFSNLREWLHEANNRGNSLYLCTARRNRENLFLQLEKFKLIGFFTSIIVTYGNEKTTQLSKLLELEGAFDWIISDSPGDIKTGKKLGLRTCSVGTGFRSNETLAKYLPDLNLASVLNFPYEHK